MRRLSHGMVIYKREVTQLLPLLLSAPVLYTMCDYGENLAGFLLFPPSSPSDALAFTLARALFWLTRLKFMFAAISVLIIVRLAIARKMAGATDD
jgi:hypothetical protein